MKIKLNDVYKLNVKDKDQYSNWCRDNVFIVKERDGELKLVDTYWNTSSDSSIYTVEEALDKGELTFYFNLSNAEEIRKWEWENYEESDRYYLGMQHSCYPHYYIKKGASESLKVKIDNAWKEEAKCQKELDSAISSYRRAVEERVRLELFKPTN